MDILIGNICSLLAMITDSISSTQKTTKRVLLWQNVGQVIYCVGAIFLRGYSAAVQNAVSLLRNLTAMHGRPPKWVEYGLIGTAVVLGIVFNNLGFWGFLPIIGNLVYSVAVFRFRENERALKMMFLFCVASFLVFNAVILNFVGVVANIVIFSTTLISLLKKR